MTTRDDIDAALSPDFKTRLRTVKQTDWADLTWRVRFLARSGEIDLYYVHDQPAQDGKQFVLFATPIQQGTPPGSGSLHGRRARTRRRK